MKKILSMMLVFLGVTAFEEKEGKKILTSAQRQKIVDEFGEDFAMKFTRVLEDESASLEEARVLDALKVQLADMQSKLTALEADKNALQAEKDLLNQKITSQQAQIDILSDLPEPDIKASGGSATADLARNEKFLFGVNVPFMSIDERHPYNKRAYASLMLNRYGIEMPVPRASSLDYESLKDDLGDFYRVRKQDRIQSFLLKLPSLESIFPLESNYQDEAALVNVFLQGSFSQAGNESSNFDDVVKGSYKFEAEKLKMFDVMFAHKFWDLKALEKNWLGYLNREGSDTMKWSFIEFIMVETGKMLHNERELRRINGRRKNPVVNVPGEALEAADGLREFLTKQIAQAKIRPFEMGEWTEENISDYVRRGTSMVPSVVRDTGKLVLYMSPDALTAYHKNNEALYGLNQDYKAGIQYVKEYPNVRIITIPNMAESKRMIWTLEGNIVLLEDQPGEMFRFYFEQQDWTLKVWSNWKESIWAYMIGKKYDDPALIPADYSTQMIFCNDVDYPSDFYIPMLADDATPSVAIHHSLVSVSNSNPVAITNIDDCVVGKEIRIKCGSPVNPVSINNSGNFSLLSAPWTPTVGESIVLMQRADGKFIEVQRITATSEFVMFANDDATPDVTGGSSFITGVNTGATAITNLGNAIYDRVYTLYGNGSTNASTIANSGNFVLSAAMTLSSGHSIKLIKSRVNNKFYEVERT
ncbi:MAG: hypothetical protein AB9842_07795 [Bacteroidales bacterium]